MRRTSRRGDANGEKRFKSPRQAQRFLSAHDPINNLFHLHRRELSQVNGGGRHPARMSAPPPEMLHGSPR